MKGRALFLPDISLTACRYLSVLIRAVAGLVWLLPGCESNHTSSSPLSLIYAEGEKKNGPVHLKKFEGGGCCVEKMELKDHIHKLTSSYRGLRPRGNAQQHLNSAGTIFFFLLWKFRKVFLFVLQEKKTILQLFKALHEVRWIFPFLVMYFFENLQIIYLFNKDWKKNIKKYLNKIKKKNLNTIRPMCGHGRP